MFFCFVLFVCLLGGRERARERTRERKRGGRSSGGRGGRRGWKRSKQSSAAALVAETSILLILLLESSDNSPTLRSSRSRMVARSLLSSAGTWPMPERMREREERLKDETDSKEGAGKVGSRERERERSLLRVEKTRRTLDKVLEVEDRGVRHGWSEEERK